MGLFVIYQLFTISKQFTYNKAEKLKSRKQIDQLFSDGKSFSNFPVKVIYLFADNSQQTLQAGVAVSSRNFKKATDRNRVKRLMREAYRLNKQPLQNSLESLGKKLVLFFIYMGKELPDQNLVSEKIQELLNRLQQKASSKI